MRKLLDALPYPAWMRGRDGRLAWRNHRFAARAGADGQQAGRCRGGTVRPRHVARGGGSARRTAGVWRARRPRHGRAATRRPFEAFEVACECGAAGLALDLSESEALRAEKDRLNSAYKSLLDRLATAVAIFDALQAARLLQRRLSAVLVARSRLPRPAPDRRRNPRPSARPPPAARTGRLPRLEGADAGDLPIDRSRSRRSGICPTAARCASSAGPNAEGGVTYLYDDATQSFALAAQVNALTRLQGETLDALKEGVAVFGADGRLRLANPAFATIWGIPAPPAAERPHFDEISQACLPLVVRLRHMGGAARRGARAASTSAGRSASASSAATARSWNARRCRCPTARR